jgi:hypothetical protein
MTLQASEATRSVAQWRRLTDSARNGQEWLPEKGSEVFGLYKALYLENLDVPGTNLGQWSEYKT